MKGVFSLIGRCFKVTQIAFIVLKVIGVIKLGWVVVFIPSYILISILSLLWIIYATSQIVLKLIK